MPIDFNDPKIPYANNAAAAEDIYEDRILYDKESFPKTGPKSMDYWYESLLYGRIDDKGRAIYLDEINLKQIGSSKTNKTIFAFDFVVEAFEGFLSYYQSALLTGCDPCDGGILIKQGMLGTDIGAYKAFDNSLSAHASYQKYMNTLYKQFSRTFMPSLGRDKQLRDFNSFFKLYRDFTNSVVLNAPVTKSNFIVSKLRSPLMSGLCIETAPTTKFPHDDDFRKYTAFINHQNFTFFRKAANKFGFMIDKHAPWRLVADINSPQMQQYMATYDTTRKDIFRKYYISAYKYDIENLKVYLQGFYNSYVAALPTVRVFCADADFNQDASIHYATPKTRMKLLQRQPISMAQIEQKLDIDYWLDYYMRLRMMEFNLNWFGTKKHINVKSLIKRVGSFKKKVDIATAIRYINKELGVIPAHYREIQQYSKQKETMDPDVATKPTIPYS